MKNSGILSVFLIIVLLLSLSACGASANTAETPAAETAAPVESVEEPAQAEATPAAEETPAEEAQPAEEMHAFAPDEEAELLDGVESVEKDEDGCLRITTATSGAEGTIELAVTLNADGLAENIEVISESETEGVGKAALSDESYLAMYYGVEDPSAVDAYSGASITSGAIADAVTLAMNEYKMLNGLEYEVPMTLEEKTAAAVEEILGTDAYETVVTDNEKIDAAYTADGCYVFIVSGTGHNEEVEIVLAVGIDSDGAISEIRVLQSGETEGVGSKVFADNNLYFYEGAKAIAIFDMPDTTRIDTISGATETSYAVFNMVNAALGCYAELHA